MDLFNPTATEFFKYVSDNQIIVELRFPDSRRSAKKYIFHMENTKKKDEWLICIQYIHGNRLRHPSKKALAHSNDFFARQENHLGELYIQYGIEYKNEIILQLTPSSSQPIMILCRLENDLKASQKFVSELKRKTAALKLIFGIKGLVSSINPYVKNDIIDYIDKMRAEHEDKITSYSGMVTSLKKNL